MSKDKKKSIIDYYLEHDEKYLKIYGPKSIVLLESGHFMEIYDYSWKEYRVARLQYDSQPEKRLRGYGITKPGYLLIKYLLHECFTDRINTFTVYIHSMF